MYSTLGSGPRLNASFWRPNAARYIVFYAGNILLPVSVLHVSDHSCFSLIARRHPVPPRADLALYPNSLDKPRGTRQPDCGTADSLRVDTATPARRISPKRALRKKAGMSSQRFCRRSMRRRPMVQAISNVVPNSTIECGSGSAAMDCTSTTKSSKLAAPAPSLKAITQSEEL